LLAASLAGPKRPEPAARRDRTSAAAAADLECGIPLPLWLFGVRHPCAAFLECGSPVPLSLKPDGAAEARARIKPVEERKSRPSTGREEVAANCSLLRPPGPKRPGARRLAGPDLRRGGGGFGVRHSSAALAFWSAALLCRFRSF